MASKIPWEWYRSFLAVLDEGSLSGAARALDITQPTVGRHIAALEQVLHRSLFTRSPSGLRATQLAHELERHARAMDSTAAALERAAASADEAVGGVVRITASEVVGVEVLPPIVAALRAQHPALMIELALSNRVQDLLHREADIAVRMTRPQQEQLVARRIGDIELGLHASDAYVARHGVPSTVDELTAHALIGFDHATPFIRAATRTFGNLTRESFALRADSDVAQLALIRAGAGIGICQQPLAQRGGLVRVLAERFSMRLETWVTMHADLRQNVACRTAFDALVAGLVEYIGASADDVVEPH
ncbi:LysR family transcriptional regulator [Uliginosibacterium sp. sgz301328]|uniref:LysR family transcriptional regulator n=1 Tax=Uliginosibacterium sp. sgz301328 TaxID=3243764 RepID=UPI00359D49EC